MNHVVIVAWTADNRVAKYQDFKTAAECLEHVDRLKGTWPDAFSTTAPSDTVSNWLVDPVAKSLSLDPITAPPPPTAEEIYDRAMQNSRVLKAVVLALNDGTFVPGSNLSAAQLKDAIRSKV